jgi:hypothetical protein
MMDIRGTDFDVIVREKANGAPYLHTNGMHALKKISTDFACVGQP